jgi:hypothetical protein
MWFPGHTDGNKRCVRWLSGRGIHYCGMVLECEKTKSEGGRGHEPLVKHSVECLQSWGKQKNRPNGSI